VIAAKRRGRKGLVRWASSPASAAELADQPRQALDVLAMRREACLGLRLAAAEFEAGAVGGAVLAAPALHDVLQEAAVRQLPGPAAGEGG